MDLKRGENHDHPLRKNGTARLRGDGTPTALERSRSIAGPITSWHCGEEITGVEGCRERERERERERGRERGRERERKRERERLLVAVATRANQDGGSGAGRKRGTLQTIPSLRKAQVMVD